jgi:hypothetical protein
MINYFGVNDDDVHDVHDVHDDDVHDVECRYSLHININKI